MTVTKISARREILTYPGDDGQAGYVGMFIDDIQVAAGIRQDEDYARRNGGAQWAMWSSLLTLDKAKPVAVRDEADVRAWLGMIGDLAEHGARATEKALRA